MFTHKKQLGISWVQGEFTAALLQGDHFKETCYKSDLIHSLPEFQTALSEAIDFLGADGADVSIVYEGHQLSHPFVQVPPLSYRDLVLYLKTRAEQEKVSDEPIIYSFRQSLKHRNKEGALLHIINKNFVDSIVKICQENRLFPVKLVPLSEIMEQELFRFNPKQDEVVLMVAAFTEMTEILVTRGDGKILFLRDLGHSSTQGQIKRLTTEIKRSMLYAHQQFNVPVQQVAIIGDAADNIASELQGQLEVPVHSAGESVKAHFWAEEAALLSPAIESNMLSIRFQFERMGIFLKRTLIYLVAIAFIITAGAAAKLEYHIKQEASQAGVMSLELENLLQKQAQISHDIAVIHTVDERIKELKNSEIAPIPGWFFSHLTSALPGGLILSEASVKKDANQWVFVLQGTVSGLASSGPSLLTTLEKNIKALPLKVNISHSWKDSWFTSIQQGGHAANQAQFRIEGTLR